jgi:hypothetical protein
MRTHLLATPDPGVPGRHVYVPLAPCGLRTGPGGRPGPAHTLTRR